MELLLLTEQPFFGRRKGFPIFDAGEAVLYDIFAQSVLSQLLDLKACKTLMPLCLYNEFQNLHKYYERTVEAFQTTFDPR